MNSLTRNAESLTNLSKRGAFSAKPSNLFVSGSSLCWARTKRAPLPTGQPGKQVGPARGKEPGVLALALGGAPSSEGNNLSLKVLPMPRGNPSSSLPINVLTKGRIVVVPTGVETSGDFGVFAHVAFFDEWSV